MDFSKKNNVGQTLSQEVKKFLIIVKHASGKYRGTIYSSWTSYVSQGTIKNPSLVML